MMLSSEIPPLESDIRHKKHMCVSIHQESEHFMSNILLLTITEDTARNQWPTPGHIIENGSMRCHGWNFEVLTSASRISVKIRSR